jgi:hypothetical protein
MCNLLLSTCPLCSTTLHLHYALCTHAALHSFGPTTCPNRMKRQRCRGERACERCVVDGERRGSLSCGPVGRRGNCVDVCEGRERRSSVADGRRRGKVVVVSSADERRERVRARARRMQKVEVRKVAAGCRERD